MSTFDPCEKCGAAFVHWGAVMDHALFLSESGACPPKVPMHLQLWAIAEDCRRDREEAALNKRVWVRDFRVAR